jgi:hypothetical protein
MRLGSLALILLAACSSAQVAGDVDARGGDAALVDARATDGATADSPIADARTDGATLDAAGPDAAAGIDAGCTIAGGPDVVLDGTGDLAAYAAAQAVPLGAAFSVNDAVRLTWSPAALFLTVRSSIFSDGSRPYHLYVEAGTALAAATPSAGKEYGGLTAALDFTPTHLIAFRRTDDFGSGAYDGVYRAGGAQPWTDRTTALIPGIDVFASDDLAELSVRVPWSALGGCPTQLRVAGHLIYGAVANEWKNVLPGAHTPWSAPGGAHYTIDLTGAPAVSSWQ